MGFYASYPLRIQKAKTVQISEIVSRDNRFDDVMIVTALTEISNTASSAVSYSEEVK